ncbi:MULTISPECIES: RHS repeat-associated core domain-containing protein [Pseudomonas]|uniref:RHS repeat-associated core domain-containing protein n=1 Tax=Pseudomonas TaxID=286 RepID=UPI003AF010AC
MHKHENHVYSAYGQTVNVLSSETLSRFNGEYFSPVFGGYLLGNGNRCYSPNLMRFLSPDTLSPFDKGGINFYAYCSGDPINYVDPSGQFSVKKLLSIRSRRPALRTAEARERHPTALSPTSSVPEGYKLVGYHGSSSKHKQSLEKGIEPQPGAENTVGAGFYFTSLYKIASMFNGGDRSKAQVFGVYTKDFNGLKEGRDFDYYGDSKELFVIRRHVFNRFVVREEIKEPLTRRNSYRNMDANTRR